MTTSELNTASVAALIVAAVSPQSVYLQQPVDTHSHKGLICYFCFLLVCTALQLSKNKYDSFFSVFASVQNNKNKSYKCHLEAFWNGRLKVHDVFH